MEGAHLYPCASETRAVVDLSGVWNFRVDFQSLGRDRNWREGLPDPVQVPVPSSFNDLFTEKDIREHVGVDRPEVHTETRENHKRAIRRMIRRDKNHPSVVMWCLANEPDTSQEKSEEYFRDIFTWARTLDPQGRPLTFTNFLAAPCGSCHAARFADVILLNRYYGWYTRGGGPELKSATEAFREELRGWEQMGRPIIISVRDRYRARGPQAAQCAVVGGVPDRVSGRAARGV